MNIEYIGHACVKVTHNNFTLLTDPWFGYPFCLDAMNAYPPIKIPSRIELEKINALHISHIHPDHFCKESLNLFNKNISIYISEYEDKKFLNSVKSLGFKNIYEIPPGFTGLEIGQFKVYSFHCSKNKFTFDSAILINCDEKSIFLNNDCILSDQLIIEISNNFKKIIGGFLGYCDIDVYPTCYDTSQIKNYNGPFSLQDQINKMHTRRTEYFIFICNQLNLDWAVPYANGIRFFDDDIYIHNRYFPSPLVFQNQKIRTQILSDLNYNDKIDMFGHIIYKSSTTTPPLSSFKKNKLNNYIKFTDDYDEKIKSAMSLYILEHCHKWKFPMTIKFIIISSEKQFDFTIYCDKKTVALSTLEPELIVEYNFFDIKNMCDGNYNLTQLHYAYKFKATILIVQSKQILIHRWPRL